MHDQIRFLKEIAEQGSVTLRVVPFQAAGQAHGGSFTIFDLAERWLPHVVCIEHLTSTHYLDQRAEVSWNSWKARR
jgi:hypothetical protein